MKPEWLLLLLPLPLGFLLDALIGDPPWLWHPVRFIGRAVSGGERLLRQAFPASSRGEFAAGLLLAVLLPLLFGIVTAAVLTLAWRYIPVLWFALETMLSYQLLAARDLKDESMAVYDRLMADDLPGAREAVSRIVGRETASLNREGVARAAVETVAENTTDGVVAPMLYTAFGGVALGLWYKAVNTLDSMIGYKNENYRFFGRASARLDDLANYLPARIAAWLMLGSVESCGYDKRGAREIYRRDNRNHASPNAAHTEAVCAGALGIRLGGDAAYCGVVHHKPTIGDARRPVEPQDIPRANRLMTHTAYYSLLLCCAIRLFLAMTLFPHG